MTKTHTIMQRAICALGLVLIAAGTAWAGAPGYYVTELVGLLDGGTPQGNSSVPNAYPGSLLSNGTVVGESVSHAYGSPGLPSYNLCSWNSSGQVTVVYSSGSTPVLWNAWGDDAGQYVVNAEGVEVYSGGTYVPVGNSNMTAPYGMGGGGLVVGSNLANTLSWAYDLNTSTYYSFASASHNSWAVGANAAGYVVGANNGQGYVWQESNQSYSTISGLQAANGISNNSQYIAGETTGGKAALYSLSGSQLATYWTGEATYVNDNGLVVGDTASGNYSGTAMAYFPNYGGQTVDLTNTYAPAGVTFNYAVGVNDVGQILVASGYALTQNLGEAYLLTPAIPGDANLDGKVDINDLTIVLAHYNQTGTTWAQGEFTGDGTVDINDLTIVLAHYNQTAGSSAAGMAAVPEPASAALLAFGGLSVLLGLAWRRRA